MIMKKRRVQIEGYENGVTLAKAWISEGLMLCPEGEVIEGGYRLVDESYTEDEDVDLNLLALWEKRAVERGDRKAQERIRTWNEETFLAYVGTIHKRALSEKLDKNRYPEVQGLAAYKDREAKGIADVFGTDYRRVLLCKDIYRGPTYMFVTEGREQGRCELQKCTTVIFKKSPVGSIIGRNMDSGIHAMDGLQTYGEPVLYQYPEEMGYSYIYPIQINSRGLMIQGSSIGYPNEPISESGFRVDGYDLILRFSETVDDAIELIGRYNLFFEPAPSSLAVVDVNGDAAIIEKTKNTFAVRKTDRRSIFTTSGVAVEKKTRKIQGDNTQTYQFEFKRHQLIENLLLEEEKAPTIEAMQRIMSNHITPSPVCRHLENLSPYSQLVTLYSFVLIPREQVYYFSLIRPGPVYPCQQESTKYSYWFI